MIRRRSRKGLPALQANEMSYEKTYWLGITPDLAPPVGGFAIGVIFGVIVTITNFCTIGAIADVTLSGDWRRFRSWGLAAAVALAGAQALDGAGLVHLASSVYLASSLDWVGALAGGLVFGAGMALAGGCPSRNLVRAAAGDLRSLTTLIVMAVFAHVALNGAVAPLREAASAATAIALPSGMTVSLADLCAFAIGADGQALRPWLAGLLVAGLLSWCLASRHFRASPRHVLAGLGVGACAVAGWAVTGAARDEFALVPVVPMSLGFVRPVADEMDYAMRFTGIPTTSFGVGLVAGCLAGALAVALARGTVVPRGFAGTGDTGRNLAGAAMMGLGGVLALGCSIGQGVSGISTMAATSFMATGAIIAGAMAGLRYLEARA